MGIVRFGEFLAPVLMCNYYCYGTQTTRTTESVLTRKRCPV